jgi:inhibitor of cysteine peptidase
LQKEVKTKTMKYGAAAVLLTILLTTFAYNFGIQPYLQPTLAQIKTFSSLEELENFLKASMKQANSYSSDFQTFGFRTGVEATFGFTLTNAVPEYSPTNIQVAGVDEADIVKTDGTYLYIVSGSTVYILWADAFSTTTFMHKITLSETSSLEIYVNGDKLAIIGSTNLYTIYRVAPESMIYPAWYYSPEVFIKIYDITNRMDPVLTRSITLNGTLGGSRMIGNYVYLTTIQSALSPASNQTNFEVALPKIIENDAVTEIQPAEIRYVNVTDIAYSFTTVVAVNILNDSQEPTHETFLAGSSTTMYVSSENMYLTIPNTNWFAARTMSAEMKQETLIYKVKLNQDKITFQAEGTVPGFVLNQFSMDEYNGFFRIATTKGWGTEATNNLYILNVTLGIVGKLENLAPTERIYSARFMSDRVYLVTFRQIDPFYVIDLTTPSKPKVLGYLKIPGFSGYLHPYDENHIIGLGKQDGKVKISLFDVTDVTAPTEAVPSFIAPGDWSDSTAINDHKAFLFDKTKQLLAIPISINWNLWVGDTYGKSWQGEYVFNLNLNNGFVFRGNVTHQESNSYQWNGNYWIKRALYIDDVLYTVSDKKVKMNRLVDLNLLKEVALA